MRDAEEDEATGNATADVDNSNSGEEMVNQVFN